MGSNMKQVAALILVNLALFSFVSTNATCPTGLQLQACVGLPLLSGGYNGQGTDCCSLINGILDAEVKLCLCNLLKQSPIGSALASALSLTSGLPVFSLLGGLLGGPIYTLTNTALNTEVSALINACGRDAANFLCA